MPKLKLILVTLFTLGLAACGSPEPNEPFLGKWVLDKEMTLQKNRGLSAEIISYLRDQLQEMTFDISDSEINTLAVFDRNGSDNQRKVRELFARPDGVNQQEDDSIIRQRGKASYKFGKHTVTVDIEGEKKIATLEFTFNPDLAKLSLKPSRGNSDFPPGMYFLRDGKYMIFRSPAAGGRMMDLYFIREEE